MVLDRDDDADTRERLEAEEQAVEYLLMSMRLREGSDLTRFRAIGGRDLNHDAIRNFVESDHLWRDGTRIGATERGRPVLNALLRGILPAT
jgi:oxygen-independent coproporphyrinogen-3 oxidase